MLSLLSLSANYCCEPCCGCEGCELLLPLDVPDCEPVPPCEPCWLELLEFVPLLELVLVLLGRLLGLLLVSRCIEPLELLDPEPAAPWSRF